MIKSYNWLRGSILTLVSIVCVRGFLQQSDPVVMKTLNSHGDRISDLEISVRRLLGANQDLQKAVVDLRTENTALKATMQVNNQNCCCNTNLPAPSPTVRNTSTNTNISPITQQPGTKISTNKMITTAQSKPNSANKTPTQTVLTTMSASTASTNVKTRIQTTTNESKTKPTPTTKLRTTTKPTAIPTPNTTTILMTSQVTSTKKHVPPSTTKMPTTSVSLNPVQCAVCTGPAFLCEHLYNVQTCAPPNNYCINKLINHSDGSRVVSRTCGTVDTCLHDWYQGSSDKDLCTNFEPNQLKTYEFKCTFCCVSDSCNVDLKPRDDTLYVPVGR